MTPIKKPLSSGLVNFIHPATGELTEGFVTAVYGNNQRVVVEDYDENAYWVDRDDITPIDITPIDN